jgi:hypothetical protein
MSVTRIALIRERADELGISQLEWASFSHAKHSDAPAFYVELRRALAQEYEQRTVFKLPANELAAQQFLPGRRNRKHYLRLTDELIRLGLIARVKKSGFAADGRRTAALFMFKTLGADTVSSVVFLADHLRR